MATNLAHTRSNSNTSTHIEDTNDFEKKILAKSEYTGYKDLFKSEYENSDLAMGVCLSVSAFMSGKAIASILHSLGDYAIYAGFIIASGIALAIFKLHMSLTKYRKIHGQNEPALTVLFYVLCVVSVAADLFGGAEWGATITGEAPKDAKTAELGGIYSPQIEAITKEIDAIESANFYWCGTHNRAHKCDKAQFYIDPVGDRKHVAKIEELKSQRSELQNTMNALLADAGKLHAKESEQHYSRLAVNQNAMRGIGLIAVAIALWIGKWKSDYEIRAANEIKKRQREAAANRYQHPQSDMPEAEAALDELTAENRRLREERDALKESIADKESRLASEIEALKRAQHEAESKKSGTRAARVRSFKAGAGKVWNFVAGANQEQAGTEVGDSAGTKQATSAGTAKTEEERYQDLIADIKAGIRDPRKLMRKHRVNVLTVNEAVRLYAEDAPQNALF